MSDTLSSSTPIAAPGGNGWLDVGQGHRVHVEQAGNPEGLPVVMLHGGPGSGSTARQRDIFDPSRWRIIQFDQRGCGRSTPAGATAHNHVDALIADIEAVRAHFGVERWLVSGGSWGSSLALAYAARHRDRVSGLVLRGVFLTGRADLDWFFHGVAAYAPAANADFIAALPRPWRRKVVGYLDRCFGGTDEARKRLIAAAWQTYESRLENPAAAAIDAAAQTDDAAQRLVAKYQVQAHYLARRCFLGEAVLLRAAASLSGMPTAIVHGSNDRTCRPSNAWAVHRRLAGSRLAWADHAGHDPFHPAAFKLLRGATDAFASDGHFASWPSVGSAAR